MMSTMKLAIWALKIFGLLILNTNQVSGSDITGLLSRLYKRAADSNRPLIVILDNSFLQSERLKRPNKLVEYLADYEKPDEDRKVHHLNNLLNKHQRKQKKVTAQYRAKLNKRAQKKQLYDAFFQTGKKERLVQPNELDFKPPIIKSLLRISNNLRCQARNECADECDIKYDGNKKNHCQNQCEVKYDCDEPAAEADPCDKDDDCALSDECGGSAECESSTKGYTLEPAVKDPCPRC